MLPKSITVSDDSSLAPLPPCACGCGRPVRRASNRFIHGHGRRGQVLVAKIATQCAHCDRTFERVPSRVSLFCSQACHLAAGRPRPPRAYPALRRDFFAAIGTEEQAYILGFLTADGSVSSSGRRFDIALKLEDRPMIEQMHAILGGGNIRLKRCATGFGPARRVVLLEVCSAPMVRDLAALGVEPNKTQTARYPVLPATVERHYVRGVWDGDGWIGRRQFMLVGTHALLQGVQTAVVQHTGCRLSWSVKAGMDYLVGSRRDCAALEWMYGAATISLSRKQEAWRTHWAGR